jgi:adenylate cyclase
MNDCRVFSRVAALGKKDGQSSQEREGDRDQRCGIPSRKQSGCASPGAGMGDEERTDGQSGCRAEISRGVVGAASHRAAVMRRRVTVESAAEFPILRDYQAAGMSDYVAIINRFAPEGIIGEMDCVYSSWVTARADGFTDTHVGALTRVVPTLALAVKAAALVRMTGTLMETYLGRDAGRRVLSGRIMRGIADRIDAVIWFSDLRGFTRITDSAPEQVIPLLNDYAEVIVSAIHAQVGDVLKLVGDGILAIFTAADRAHACAAALAAATAARTEVAALNLRRARDGLPVTDMYLGLHVGEVFYGNVGSTERLDFTVVGPAVNEASRIAAMCRSVEQPVLVSEAFANVHGMRGRLISVGRYALRGVTQPQELFTLDSAQAN